MQLRIMLVLIVIALFIPVGTSFPEGIGAHANDGCLCHGEKNSNTQIEIQGLPDTFESDTTYNFSIEVISQTIPADEEGEKGGFRLLITDGFIDFNTSEGLIQDRDNGWTHTEAGNFVRIWNLSFTSPDDNTSYVDFTIHGNAVNANQASSGDQWNSVKFRLPGVLYEGELLYEEIDEFSPTDYAVGIVSLLVLTYILVTAFRD